jgi:1D-myo-inositol 3-kinase
MGHESEERERGLAMKPPTSPMTRRAPSWSGRGLHVDVSRLCQSAGALDSSHPPLYSPLASPFAPDLTTEEEALLWVDELALKENQKAPDLKEGKYMRRHSLRKRDQCAALVVGHYCHDQLTLQGGEVAYSLGGSVSYITNVFGAVGMECKGLQVASKVGPDFMYRSDITHPPIQVEDQLTTEFFADFTQGEERVLKAGNICAPIEPADIPDMQYELGLAVGIACEVLPETLQHMVEVSRYVVVDVQALIRTIDPDTGLVGLRNLEETPFYDMLEDISFLKAARNEALYIDIEKVRQKTCVIVTEGKNGSRIYSADREFRVPAFPAVEVDPTGAGDSFLAGFSAGLYQGLPVEQAVLMGNYFGGMAVGQVGIPRFTASQLESMEETRVGVHIEQIPFEHRGELFGNQHTV